MSTTDDYTDRCAIEIVSRYVTAEGTPGFEELMLMVSGIVRRHTDEQIQAAVLAEREACFTAVEKEIAARLEFTSGATTETLVDLLDDVRILKNRSRSTGGQSDG